AGADDFVLKPFNHAELLARVKSLLRVKQAQDELAELNRTLEARVTEQVGELDRLGQLRRFLSPQLANLVNAGDESLLESHRRQIAVVFTDLRGFTDFSETAEPEDAMDVLREYHEAMGAQIHRYDGTVGFFAGDGLMVFFNDPMPCDDPAVRAVRMAAGMRDDMDRLTAAWEKRGFELGWGAGLHFGYATLGRVGYEGRWDYTAIGSVVNQASRLCAEAKPGQIIISQRVLADVEDLAEVTHIGDFELKGFHKPVAAYNVAQLKQAALAG
ncbi:MAG TPA: adenylate/guanylate cyclase domain-containing protein, partial [Chloroflexota bacterium]|nr:adenylate/guanylate cyclase domain-containing protein [Chloroflexota bacterium]